jgi:putative DNA primase/helicase
MGASPATAATVLRPPRPPEPLWENIPEQLIAERRWVLWRYELVKGKFTKIPLQPDGRAASSTDPETWAPFDFVQSAYLAGGFDGVGFVFNGDGLSGFDFDHCISGDGVLEPKIAGYLEQLDTYSETTPSGSGVHAIVICGELPGPDRKAGPCEIYRDARYFTVTGRRLEGARAEVNACDETVAALYRDIFAERIAKRNTAAHASTNGNRNGASLDDAQLLDRARKAKNGEYFIALYDAGNWQGQGFPSQSEADLSLNSLLAFYTGRDAVRMDALFRGSALYREKWLRDDYRERTLNEAIAGCAEVYTARVGRSAEQVPSSTKEAIESDPPGPMSDIALSNRLVNEHGADLRYAKKSSWFIYDESRGLWADDSRLRIFTEAKRLCTRAAHETYQAALLECADEASAKRAAAGISSAKKVAAVVDLAKSHPRIVVTEDQFDRDNYLLNTPLGPVDLRTAELRAARRDDYFTKTTCVGPRDIPTPLFDRFLREVMGGHIPPEVCECAACTASVNKPADERQAAHIAEVIELERYFYREHGYMLTGDVKEQALFMDIGDGGNGKGVKNDFISIDIMGDSSTGYSCTIPIEALLIAKGERHPTELMCLQHARFALAREADEGTMFNAGRVKTLTGSDPISARRMHMDFITITPTHHLLVFGNTFPTLRGADKHAWRRRLHLVFYQQKFADEADPAHHIRKADKGLRAKLQAEAPGVLFKLIAGCREWQRLGLAPPATVRAAADRYLRQQNLVARWADERCDRSNPHATATLPELWTDFSVWAAAGHEDSGKRLEFRDNLERFGIKITRSNAERGICRGITVKASADDRRDMD